MVKWIERIEFIESEKTLGLGEGGRNEDDEYFDLLPNILMIPGTEHGSLDQVGVLLARLRLQWLLHDFSPRLVWTAYVCVNCFITVGLLALLAFATGSPFVFPSLGPTAYLFFSPLTKASSPRHTLLGHAIGLVCGYAAFALTMSSAPPFSTHAGSMVRQFWPPLFRSRPRARSWFCFG
jgi:hypothetical protein